MMEKRSVGLLVLIMMIVTALSVAVAIYGLYKTSIGQQLDRLRVAVQSRARLIESFSRHIAEKEGLAGQDLFDTVLTSILNAHERFDGFGRTGEFVIAKIEGDTVRILFEKNVRGVEYPPSLPLGSKLGTPIQKAAAGESGVLIGLDYGGRRVIAAYESVAGLGLGIVNKIELAEVRAPLIRSGLLAVGVSAVLILIGAGLFIRLTRPWIQRIVLDKARYHGLVENINSAVAVYEAVEDGRDFIFKECNKACEWIEKTTRGEIVGRKVTEAFPGVEEFGLLDVFRRVWKTGIPEHHPESFYKDNRIQGWRKNYVYKLPSGELVAVYDDVTERRTKEEEVLKSRRLLIDIVDNSATLIYMTDLEGHFLLANNKLAGVLGTSRDMILGNTREVFLPPEVIRSHRDNDLEVIRDRRPIIFEEEYVEPEGRRVYLSMKFPVFDGTGKIYAVGGISTDITNQKKAEEDIRRLNEEMEELVRQRTAELEAANHELESFAYSVSHDLRAPLRTINGFSQALIEDCSKKLGAEGLKDLGRIRAAARKMAELIDDLLRLSRVTRTEMGRERVDLSRVAEETMVELRSAEPSRDVEVSIEPGMAAWGDPGLLRIAVQCLLDNAWKFSAKKDRARIEFGSLKMDREAVFFVRDNGVGFDMKYADKLFGAFQRLHRQEDFPGTGIGLATVQRIVHRHGGRVWAEGAVNQGATFSFSLPGRESNKGG